ncbi:septum formation protein [Sulfurivirga caldicuralii]|uniref:7-methyl-GTP pyrophosphatase n=1 Tax=Sulfurivirga caldicuralii TaxID=364032 RepID=A0A1N6EM86_9GAMM|nr:Maf family protein [Sulfurivirga caldicuralii]SIN84156.1 septum formation protein [Sulfurivirga caldicuralii]
MLILASTSPYRRALLEKLQLPFECMAPQVDETPAADEPIEQLVQRLSEAKARAIATNHPNAWVIGSDQSATVAGQQLVKPGTRGRARQQLKLLSGQRVAFHTGLSVCHGDHCLTTLDTTWTQFRTLDDALIDYYLDHEQPWNCAGAIKSEGLGIILIKRIENDDPNALIGLPLIKLIDLLSALDYPFPWKRDTGAATATP